jgi:hypothetical protein
MFAQSVVRSHRQRRLTAGASRLCDGGGKRFHLQRNWNSRAPRPGSRRCDLQQRLRNADADATAATSRRNAQQHSSLLHIRWNNRPRTRQSGAMPGGPKRNTVQMFAACRRSWAARRAAMDVSRQMHGRIEGGPQPRRRWQGEIGSDWTTKHAALGGKPPLISFRASLRPRNQWEI